MKNFTAIVEKDSDTGLYVGYLSWPFSWLCSMLHSFLLMVNLLKQLRIQNSIRERSTWVGYVPGFPGAHSQGESLDELQKNLREVIEMLLEDGEPKLETEFVGTQTIAVW